MDGKKMITRTDIIHTNEQRIEKIRNTLKSIERIQVGNMTDIYGQLESLATLAVEAQSSLKGIEQFLEERNALDLVE